jgi:RNA polymerase sigma-70 factor, ECF subfamily
VLTCLPETADLSFEALCARLRPDVYRFALWLSKDRGVAEDVVQETFMRAWHAIDSLDDPNAVRPWLLAIARREHARLYERKRHITIPLDPLIAADDPVLASVPSEDHSDLSAAIYSMEPDYRKPIVLQALMGYSTEEIAGQLGLTRSTVLTRLHRARQKLRVALLGTPLVATSDSVTRKPLKTNHHKCCAV